MYVLEIGCLALHENMSCQTCGLLLLESFPRNAYNHPLRWCIDGGCADVRMLKSMLWVGDILVVMHISPVVVVLVVVVVVYVNFFILTADSFFWCSSSSHLQAKLYTV
jgi:hypothetical protein